MVLFFVCSSFPFFLFTSFLLVKSSKDFQLVCYLVNKKKSMLLDGFIYGYQLLNYRNNITNEIQMQLSCYMLNKGDIPTGESRKYLQREVGKKSNKKQITLWNPYSLSCVVKIRVNPFSSANLSRWRQRRRPFFKNTDDEQYYTLELTGEVSWLFLPWMTIALTVD